MAYKISNIALPGGCTIEVENDTLKGAWREVALLQSIPHICPVDGTPTRFGYAERGGSENKYFVLLSTGTPVYEFKFGQEKTGGGLFPGQVKKMADGAKKTVQRWTYYDRELRQEVVVWENGRLLQSPHIAAGETDDDDLGDEATTPTGISGPEARRIEAHRLGSIVYGTEWPSTQSRLVESTTDGVTDQMGEMSADGLTRMIDYLTDKAQRLGKAVTGQTLPVSANGACPHCHAPAGKPHTKKCPTQQGAGK